MAQNRDPWYGFMQDVPLAVVWFSLHRDDTGQVQEALLEAFNPSAQNSTGRVMEQGQPISELFPGGPQDRENWLEFFNGMTCDDTTYTLQYYCQEEETLLRGIAGIDTQNRAVLVLWESLVHPERGGDLFFQDVGLWVYDVETEELACTESFNTLYGSEDTKIFNREDLHAQFVPGDRPLLEQAFQKAVEGFGYTLPVQMAHREDRKQWVQIQGQPLYSGWKVNRVLGAITPSTMDIERGGENFTNAMTDRAILYDAHGIITWAGSKVQDFCGRALQDLIGLTCQEIFFCQAVSCIQCPGEEVLRTGKTRMMEKSLPRGESLNVILHPLLSGAGEVTGCIELLVDRAHKPLWHTAESLEHMLTNMEEVIWSLSWSDFQVLYMSSSCAKVLGYGVEEFVRNGNLWNEIVHPEDSYRLKEDLQALSGQEYGEGEYRVIRKDGSIIWIYTRARMIYDEQGEPFCIRGITLDITRRKEAELALKEREWRYESLVEHINDALYIHDFQGNMLEVNDNACRVLGYTREEFRTLNIAQINSPEDLEKMPRRMETLMEKGSVVFQGQFLRKDGTMLPGEISAKVVSTEGQGLVYTLGRDITNRLEIEEKLKKHHDFLTKLTDTVPGVLFQYRQYPNGQASFPFVSSGIEDLLGLTAADIEKDAHLFYERIHKGDLQRVFRSLQQSLHTGGIWEFSFRVSLPDRGIRWLQGKARPQSHADYTQYYGHIHDYTKEKEMNRDLRIRDQAMAASLNAMALANMDGILTYVNPSFLRLWKIGKEEALGRKVSTFLEDTEELDAIKAILLKEGRYTGEILARRDDQSTMTLHLSATLMYSEEGHPMGMMASCIDISRRIENEKALHRNQERYRTLFETMVQGVVYQGADGKILSANPAAEKVLGLSLEQMQGRTSVDPRWRAMREDGSPFPGEEHPAMIALTTGQAVHDVVMGVFSPQEEMTKWININAIPQFLPEQDKPYQVYTTFEDITDKKEAEKQLSSYAEELKGLYQQLDDEIKKATELHERNLPSLLPEVEGLAMMAHYQPARRLGGDFYNVMKTQDKLVFFLSDVMGHGMEGALLSVFIKEVIDSYVILCPDSLQPDQILAHLNKQYRREGYPHDYFISIFIAVLDLSTFTLSYTGAGFQSPLFLKTDTGEEVEITVEGVPISMAVPQELMEYRVETLQLKPGSTLFLSTDGLLEQEAQSCQFQEQAREVFFQHCHLPPVAIVEAINEEFSRFIGTLQVDDDITFVVLQMEENTEQEVQLELKSDFAELRRMEDTIMPLIKDHPRGIELMLAIHELVANAIEHGNRFDRDKTVKVGLKNTGPYIQITVADQGMGFDWQERLEKELELQGWQERGRGVFMLQCLSQYLFYNKRGNSVLCIISQEEKGDTGEEA